MTADELHGTDVARVWSIHGANKTCVLCEANLDKGLEPATARH